MHDLITLPLDYHPLGSRLKYPPDYPTVSHSRLTLDMSKMKLTPPVLHLSSPCPLYGDHLPSSSPTRGDPCLHIAPILGYNIISLPSLETRPSPLTPRLLSHPRSGQSLILSAAQNDLFFPIFTLTALPPTPPPMSSIGECPFICLQCFRLRPDESNPLDFWTM